MPGITSATARQTMPAASKMGRLGVSAKYAASRAAPNIPRTPANEHHAAAFRSCTGSACWLDELWDALMPAMSLWQPDLGIIDRVMHRWVQHHRRVEGRRIKQIPPVLVAPEVAFRQTGVPDA